MDEPDHFERKHVPPRRNTIAIYGMPPNSLLHFGSSLYREMRESDASQTSLMKSRSSFELPNLEGDYMNILILFFFYILQGIPQGLAGSIPLLLTQKGATYSQQAAFSFNGWPFSMKLLWAPFVDAIYSKRFGRRKSWLVPAQYGIGLTMLWASRNVNQWISHGIDNSIIMKLLVVFFFLNLLAATQDIAVDGWALTMLKSVGESVGYYISYVLFLALESPEFANTYIRTEPLPKGIITFGGFLHFWGLVFLITTTVVMIFKREGAPMGEGYEGPELSVLETYMFLFRILIRPCFFLLCSALFTVKVGFAAVDGVTALKLIENGVPRETMALLVLPLLPVNLILPLVIARQTAGPYPLSCFLKAAIGRLFVGIPIVLFVWSTPFWKEKPHYPFPKSYYAVLILLLIWTEAVMLTMYVTEMAFFNQISDPSMGGTYMTLLNTVANLGADWPKTFILWFIDPLTFKYCSQLDNASCTYPQELKDCLSAGGKCQLYMDGYVVCVFITTILGIIWMFIFYQHLKTLEVIDKREWRLPILQPSVRSLSVTDSDLLFPSLSEKSFDTIIPRNYNFAPDNKKNS